MGNPHVLVIPYPAQGHVIPLMEFSQSLVKHGIRITFVNTDYNHKRLMSALSMKDSIRDRIHLVSVPLEQEHPEIMNQPDKRFETILWFMPRKVEELIERINATDNDKITCVVADHLLGWAMKIAVEKGIRGASFGAVAATHLVIRSSVLKLIDEGIINDEGFPTKKQVFQLLPTMPAMSTAHIAWTCLGCMKVQKLYFENVVRNNPATKLADWVLCNSAYDLEPAAFDFDPKFTPIGPLLASNRFGDMAGSFWPEDLTCLEWLDQQPSQSVVFIAFGSSTTFDRTQFHELAMAFELSNRPFLWVVRPGITEGINEAYVKGFQERISTRGRVISWAPQQKVLGHPSIACFLSHCGWNSTMEGVSNGIPFLCWPYYGDQFHNENYICNVWKVGLGFNRNEKGIITQEEIKNKVEELLDNGECRANAINLKERLMISIKEGGGSYNHFKHFVEWLKA